MIALEPTAPTANREPEAPQRFIFQHADWEFYQHVGQKLIDRRVFITYYKGKLEVVTTSLVHEAISGLLVIMVRVLAEETNTPLKGAGASTLARVDLDEGAEPDSSFYTTNEPRMRGKTQIDLTVDPPPDLAIEVEVTRRLGDRKSIFRDIGVPEVWVYNAAEFAILLHRHGQYAAADRSPTFPALSAHELAECVAAGLTQDETSFAKSFRLRVRAALAAGASQA